MYMGIEDTLLAYSEWLDGEHLIKSEEESKDDRDHGRLAQDFIEHWESDNATPCLRRAGLPEEPKANLGMASTHDLLTELMARADVSKSIGEQWPNYKTIESE